MGSESGHAERLALDALAVYRLTRLVTEDVLTQPARDRFILWALERDPRHRDWPAEFSEAGLLAELEGDPQELVGRIPEPPKLAYFVTCRWCAGMWVALGVVLVARRFRWWPTVADVLAVSAAAALVAGLER